MKIKGREFIDWYDNHFPEGYYHESDDGIETHNEDGSWAVDPDADYDTDAFGYLAKEAGPGERFSHEHDLTIESQIKAYRKTRDFDFVALQVPKAKADEIMAYLKANGCKVVK